MLVEHAPALRSGGYVLDFWGLGYDIAERMGLEDELNRTGYHIREMRIVNERNKRVAGFGTSVFVELTDGRYVTIARSALSRLLVEKIKDSVEIISVVTLSRAPPRYVLQSTSRCCPSRCR